jgi:hypothetical protein
MKALSIRQPWAWLVVNGWKFIENRAWSMDYRGLLLIHASQNVDRQGINDLENYFCENGEQCPNEFYDPGGIVRIVDLVECVSDPQRLTEDPLQDYEPGSIAWVVENPRPCELILYPGRLRVF